MKYTHSNPVSGPGKIETIAPKIFFNNIPKGKTMANIIPMDHKIAGSINSTTAKIFVIVSCKVCKIIVFRTPPRLGRLMRL